MRHLQKQNHLLKTKLYVSTFFVCLDTGIVYACGDNKSGQCGVGNTTPMITKPTRIKYRGPQIIKVGCGAEFSVILDIKGNLHTFGCPEYGQLGKLDIATESYA